MNAQPYTRPQGRFRDGLALSVEVDASKGVQEACTRLSRGRDWGSQTIITRGVWREGGAELGLEEVLRDSLGTAEEHLSPPTSTSDVAWGKPIDTGFTSRQSRLSGQVSGMKQ